MTNDTQDDVNPATASLKRAAPSMYVVLRSGSTTPEIFQADNDEDALSRLDREARVGQIAITYWYKLMGAVEFVPTSRISTLEDIVNNPAMSPSSYSKKMQPVEKQEEPVTLVSVPDSYVGGKKSDSFFLQKEDSKKYS